MKKRLAEEHQPKETSAQTLARHVTTPESLSASVLTLTHKLNHSQLTEMVDELKQQSAAVHKNDLSRAESILMSQAHTLDGLFAKLASKALAAEQRMRPGITPCVIKVAATYAVAIDRSHSPAASAGA